MTRVYRARCLRDTAQDNPYQYFKAGVEYTIPEDCPVAKHFEPLEELHPEHLLRINTDAPPGTAFTAVLAGGYGAKRAQVRKLL